jgi:hypothetical protein
MNNFSNPIYVQCLKNKNILQKYIIKTYKATKMLFGIERKINLFVQTF